MKDYTDALKAFGEYVASLPWTGPVYYPIDTTLCEQRKCSWFLDAYFEEDAEHKLKGNLFHMAISYRGSEEHFYPNGDKYLLHQFKECTNPDLS